MIDRLKENWDAIKDTLKENYDISRYLTILGLSLWKSTM